VPFKEALSLERAEEAGKSQHKKLQRLQVAEDKGMTRGG
jgi:hypothetical protein